MTREQALTMLGQRYHPEQVREYVERAETEYGPVYWEWFAGQEETLLLDMNHFVEAQAMKRHVHVE